MTDDLREQVARRLIEVGNAADQTDDFMHNHRRAMPAIADEVIRIAEWARRNHVRQSREALGQHDNAPIIMRFPLTLPPEDWKP